MTRYLRVQWRHDDPRESDEATVLYHEVHDDEWESRRVEVFADGRIAIADAIQPDAPTSLSVEPLPSAEDIAAEPEFDSEVIDRVEFEAMWSRGQSGHSAS
jgi:hypothetical protein